MYQVGNLINIYKIEQNIRLRVVMETRQRKRLYLTFYILLIISWITDSKSRIKYLTQFYKDKFFSATLELDNLKVIFERNILDKP